jgi:hypothetical protein
LSRTQPTSQFAPFASIRSSQIEPKQKSHTDDIPVTPSPRPQFSQIHSFPPHSFLNPEFTEQQGQRDGEFLVPPLRPPCRRHQGRPWDRLRHRGRSCRVRQRRRPRAAPVEPSHGTAPVTSVGPGCVASAGTTLPVAHVAVGSAPDVCAAE